MDGPANGFSRCMPLAMLALLGTAKADLNPAALAYKLPNQIQVDRRGQRRKAGRGAWRSRKARALHRACRNGRRIA